MTAKIVVILPAYNEELTIGDTVRAFAAALPDSQIWVVNNNSSDNTEKIARSSLAELNNKGGVLNEYRQGKGNAVRRAFHEVDADVYVMSDADFTYPADEVHKLLKPILNGEADMAVGDRHSEGNYKKENKRPLHNFGNRLVVALVNKFFNASLVDIMSGYRVFSRRFVKNYPILVDGFEIETDLTLHALDKRFRIVEVPINYKDRPEGSLSKLNTVRDGFKVLNTIQKILRHYRPLFFFNVLALFFLALTLITGIFPVMDYILYRHVYHVPLAILSSGLGVISILLAAIGLILDSIMHQNKSRFECDLLKFK